MREKPSPSENLDPVESAYDRLRKLAARYLADQPGHHTLQPTALVNEAWLRLRDANGASTGDRGHFVARAAQAMRHVLVDHARRQRSAKRGHGWKRVTLSDSAAPSGTSAVIEAIALDDAIEDVSAKHPDLAKLAELRLFGGLTLEQCAGILEWPLSTTKSRWTYTSALLSRALWNAD